jgi:repressor LexA
MAAFQERHGRTPSGPEIARALQLKSSRSPYLKLRRAAADGLLHVEQTARRAPLRVRFTARGRALVRQGWPRLGAIPAGPLDETLGQVEDAVAEVRDLLPELRDGDFFLTVEGESMVGDGLTPGMTVVLRPDAPWAPGAICAVWVDGEGGTLKRVYPDGDHYRLEPANARFAPRRVPVERVRIQGVLVMSLDIRRFR